MQNQLQRAIYLIKKTGDKLLVADNSNNVYAVMNLDEYEEMIVNKSEVRGLTDDELVDKINRDIAIWKSDKYDEKIDFEDEEIDFEDDVDEAIDDQMPVWEDQIKGRGFKPYDAFYEEKEDRPVKKRKKWSIPKDRMENAEEVIEEDRQYLEEVPF